MCFIYKFDIKMCKYLCFMCFLSRLIFLIFFIEMLWFDRIVNFSGFFVEDISRCVFYIYEKW